MLPKVLQKGNCHDCTAYEHCPRMRGINRCISVLKQQRARAIHMLLHNALRPAQPAHKIGRLVSYRLKH